MKLIEKFSNLKRGWNGYEAPVPNIVSIDNAQYLLDMFEKEDIQPSRVAPSVLGGVGLSFYNGLKEVYIEVLNQFAFTIHVLCADNYQIISTRTVSIIKEDIEELIQFVKDFLLSL